MLFLFRKSKADKSSTTSPVVAAHKHKHTHNAGAWGDCSADGGWEGKVACGSKEAYVVLVTIYKKKLISRTDTNVSGCGSGCGGGCGGGGCGGGEFVASEPSK